MDVRKLDEKTSVSGQLAPSDVATLKELGVSMIVCNRPDGEDSNQPTAAQIERAAEAIGLQFRYIPIVRGIGPADVEAMQEALDAARGPVHAYCRSGNRSTLAWAVARREQGATVGELEQAARNAGVDLTPIAHLL